MLLKLLLCVLLLPAFLAAQANDQSDAKRSAIVGLRQMWADLNAARTAGDRRGLERVYAEEFLFVHQLSGGVVDRAQHIDRMVAEPQPVPMPSPAFERLALYGDVAMLRTVEANRFSTTMYARRDGRWQIIQQQGTPLPASRRPMALDAALLAAYEGEYRQGGDGVTIIQVEVGRLRVSFPNWVVWTVEPVAEDHFALPDSLNQMIFHRDDTGVIRGYTAWLPSGVLFRGTRRK